METTFRIQGVNGIDDLAVTINGPGVYVARGPNGAGKSSAIEALKAANGDTTAKAEPTDGTDKGKVEGGGVLLAVGHRRKLNGLPSVRLVSTGAIGQLIDPQIKDGTLAAKARLRALLQLMPLPADEAARMELTANDEELQTWIRTDPASDAMDLGESVRKRANELACELEKKSAEASGEEQSLHGLINELGKLDFEAGDLASAVAAAEEAARKAAVMVQTARARAALETQQKQVKELTRDVPDVAALRETWQLICRKVEAVEAELKSAAHRRDMTKAELQQAEDNLRKGEAEAQRQAQVMEILKRPVEGPTIEEATASMIEADRFKARVEQARKVDTAKNYMARAEGAKEVSIKYADRAKQLRGIAAGTATALGRLLERRGLPGLVIQEGRLGVVQPDQSVKDFDLRLSFGQRVRTALGVALAGLDANYKPAANGGQEEGKDQRMPILALEPTFWLALDEVHRGEVVTIARERGVCLVTEEPGDGPLRFEAESEAKPEVKAPKAAKVEAVPAVKAEPTLEQLKAFFAASANK